MSQSFRLVFEILFLSKRFADNVYYYKNGKNLNNLSNSSVCAFCLQQLEAISNLGKNWSSVAEA